MVEKSVCKLSPLEEATSSPWEGTVLLRKLRACCVTVHRNS